jgi:PAS domain S-box-containing protein
MLAHARRRLHVTPGIRATLLGAFALLALFTGGLGWYTVLTLERLNDGQRTVYGDVFGGTHLLAEWIDESWQARWEFLEALFSDDPADWAAVRPKLQESDQRLQELARQMDLADTDREDVATQAQLNAAWEAYTNWRDVAVLGALERGDRAAAIAAYRTDGVVLGNRLNQTIDGFLAKKRQVGGTLQAEAEESFDFTRRVAMLMSAAAAGLGLLIGFFLSRSIARPVGQLATAAKALASGDVDQQISLSSNDEIGRLAEAFREMIAYQQAMAHVADAMARGDLTHDVQPSGPNDQLGLAFQHMIRNLRTLVGQLEDALRRANQMAEVAEEREARVRAVMESVADAIVIIDDHAVVDVFNPAAERVFGYSAASMVGQRATMLLADQSSDVLLTVGTRQEIEGLRSDGNVFPMELAVSEMRLADRRYVIASVRDITDRKRAEARFRALLESAPDALVTVNREGRISLVNTQAERLFGYDRLALLGRPVDLLLPRRLRGAEAQQRLSATVGDTTDRAPFELSAMRSDGSDFPVEISLSPLEDEDGVITISVIRDITARKRAEAAQRFLAEASALLAASLDYETTLASVARLAVPFLADACTVDVVEDDGAAHPLAVAVTDPAGAALSGKLGDLPQQVLRSGTALLAMASEPMAPPVLRESAFRAVLLVPLVFRQRTFGVISFAAAESRRDYGTADVELAEELAHRCALAIENARLYREAQSAVRLRDEFFSVAAHELKTPVAALLAFTQFMLKRGERQRTLPPAQVRDALEEVHWQSDRIARLVSQLLDTSRLDAGKFAVHPQLTELTGLVGEAVRTARRSTGHHMLSLRAEPDLWGLVDPVYFEQVLTNLVDNAIKYSPDGGGIEVDLRHVDPRRVRLSVRDHGIGIPPEHRARIFDRFYQAHAGQHFAGVAGMGLGLYISRRIVELHGGTITLESPADGGVLVAVTLPVGIATFAPEAICSAS